MTGVFFLNCVMVRSISELFRVRWTECVVMLKLEMDRLIENGLSNAIQEGDSIGDVAKKAGELWKTITGDEKKKWEKKVSR